VATTQRLQRGGGGRIPRDRAPALDAAAAREALESSPVPIVIIAAQRLVFANRAAIEALGYGDAPPEEYLGRDGYSFVAPAERPASLANGRRLLRTGENAVNLPRMMMHRSGRQLLALCAVGPISWHGQPALEIGFMILSGTDAPPDRAAGLTALSPRERQVALLVARGFGTTVIATTLGLQDSTVRAHLKAVYRKAGCHTRVELAQLVLGLQPPTS
jgi:PAS domain S-box-containing protein